LPRRRIVSNPQLSMSAGGQTQPEGEIEKQPF
jgi:hypothetical protein